MKRTFLSILILFALCSWAGAAAPTLSSAVVGTDGVTLTLTFSESVSIGVGGNGGWTIVPSDFDATVSYASGDGTAALVYTVNRIIWSAETATIDYAQPGDGIENGGGEDLANISDGVVTNNSEKTPPENLNQMLNRKSRHATASWGADYLEADEAGHYIWQPETLCYYDVTTGHEVWRLSNTPGLSTFFNTDLNQTAWSADGNRLAFVNYRQLKEYEKDAIDGAWFVVKTDGTYLRAILNGSAVGYWGSITVYHIWSPVESDIYYGFGNLEPANPGVSRHILYRTMVEDESESREEWITYPTDRFIAHSLVDISTCGNMVLSNGVSNASWLYFATVYPSSAKGLLFANGYTVDRDMDSVWGDTPESFVGYHGIDLYKDGTWVGLMPSGSHAIWKIKVAGSAADGGAIYSFSPPMTFDEEWPIKTVDTYGGMEDPFGLPYLSHGCVDPWGRYEIFSNGETSPAGPGIVDLQTMSVVVETFGGGAQHNNWNGWTDWPVSSKGPVAYDYSNDAIRTQKYNNADSQLDICSTHTLFNNNGAYNGAGAEYTSIPRPVQSPDGTKVQYHSTFLNSKTGDYDNKPDVYWSVVYYPYPPEITGATMVSSHVRLMFDFRHKEESGRRTYTDRGWPDEDNDNAPLPREIEYYRLWYSNDGSTWVPASWLKTPGDGSDWFYLIPQAVSTTRYYALTSIEYSGLESRTLSNTWQVTLDGDGAITTSAEDGAYPADPGGDDTIYATAPDAPSGVAATHQAAPADQVGQYTIEWTEPDDSRFIRYYNIYAMDDEAPSIDANFRIASIPKGWCSAGVCSWIDCFGATDGGTDYIVTAVDRWGNESTAGAE